MTSARVQQALAIAAAMMGGDPSEVRVGLPAADCGNCKHRKPDGPGQHCYMFKEKPGLYCGQFSRDEKRGAPSSEEIAAQMREERRQRKAAEWAKRQPKGKT